MSPSTCTIPPMDSDAMDVCLESEQYVKRSRADRGDTSPHADVGDKCKRPRLYMPPSPIPHSAMAGGMFDDITPTVLQSITEHVFLPPKCPQEGPAPQFERMMNMQLTRLIARFASDFIAQLSDPEPWYPVVGMLQHLQDSADQSLERQSLAKHMLAMEPRDVLALHIRAQNAGVVIRKEIGRMVFEVFEVSPPNREVMGTAGKLVRQYPGPAVAVSRDVCDDQYFLDELASFLCQMDVDILDSTATSTKAGSTVSEERDTADPKYISQLLIGILRGLGDIAEVRRVTKRICDDVLWKDSLLPWRRSPLWLVIRVALHTTLPTRDEYKAFMAYSMAKLLKLSLIKGFDSELLFAMRAKLSRRVYKLADSVLPKFVLQEVSDAVDLTEALLRGRWDAVLEEDSAPPRGWDPSRLKPDSDTILSLPNALPSILKAKHIHARPSRSPFTPPNAFNIQGDLDISSLASGQFANALISDPLPALYSFETTVQSGLDSWVTHQLNSATAPTVLSSCMKQYFKAAQKNYTSSPESLSIMVLTLMELWVALDKITTNQCPLLLSYSCGIPPDFLQHLLIRDPLSLERAQAVELYLHLRLRGSTCTDSIFSDRATPNSFAVRYFDRSDELKELLARIERDANYQRDARRADLRNRNAQAQRISSALGTMQHKMSDSQGGKSHSSNCPRCVQEKKLKKMKIPLYEWPLPADPLTARMVVFELACPQIFSVWRDMTYFMLTDMGMQDKLQTEVPKVKLREYGALSPYSRSASHSRLTLASTTKSFLKSHYATVKIPATEASVLVNNGLSYRLFDNQESRWVSGAIRSSSLPASYGTFSIPDNSAYKYLEFALAGTSHTSNDIIARQADCPSQINLQEHLAYGGLRSGGCLQWLNLCRELVSNQLSFSTDEVQSLLLQAAWQLGPLDPTGNHWKWHDVLHDPDFGRTLVAGLNSRLDLVASNWRESGQVRMIVLLLLRLLASATHSETRVLVYNTLRKVRGITSQWLDSLSVSVQSWEAPQTLAEQFRLCDLALTTRATYDVGHEVLQDVMCSSSELATYVRCGIILRYNLPPSGFDALPDIMRHAITRDQRMSLRVWCYIQHSHEASLLGPALDEAITSAWPAFNRSSSSWMFVRRDLPWFTCQVRGSEDTHSTTQAIHLNILDGQLLVDGLEIGRLPQVYLRDETYSRLFGQHPLAVVPTGVPGFEFSSQRPISGHWVYFTSTDDGTVTIRIARLRDRKTYQLIPAQLLQRDFPAPFLHDHIHCLNLENNVLEFRPLSQPWKTDARNWQLVLRDSPQMYRRQYGQYLIDPYSHTFNMVASRVQSLESRDQMYMILDSNASLSIHLPRLKLSFFLNSSGRLESRELRGMAIDDNQSVGAMFGLQNRLTLTNTPGTAAETILRQMIVPYGAVQVAPIRSHVTVSIDTTRVQHLQYYVFTVDQTLGHLTGPADLRSRFFKIYLHAVTSGCLTDPLTGRTGIEEAMYELHSSRSLSFMHLSQDEMLLLTQIAALSAQHSYYPAHFRNMQSIKWNPDLSVFSQYPGLRIAASRILLHMKDLECIQVAASETRQIHLDENTLSRRAMARYSVCFPWEFSLLLPGTLPDSDSPWTSRDLIVGPALERERVACRAVRLFRRRATSLYDGTTSLRGSLKSISDTKSTMADILLERGPLQLSYSSAWLKVNLREHWFVLCDLWREHVRSPQNVLEFRRVFTLGPMLYASPHCLTLVPAVSAMMLQESLHEFSNSYAHIRRPQYSEPSIVPSVQVLKNIVMNCTRPFSSSPASSTKKTQAKAMRQYNAELERRSKMISESLRNQWPNATLHLNNKKNQSNAQWFDLSLCISKAQTYFSEYLQYIRELDKTLDKSPRLPETLTDRYNMDNIPMSRVAHIAPALTITSLLETVTVPQSNVVTNALEELHGELNSDLPIHSQYFAGAMGTLRAVLGSKTGQGHSSFATRYVQDLSKSVTALEGEVVTCRNTGLPEQIIPPLETLSAYYARCRDRVEEIHSVILRLLAPPSSVQRLLLTSGLWPRISRRSILEQLRNHLALSATLPANSKALLIYYAFSLITLQRSQRLLLHYSRGQLDAFFREFTSYQFSWEDANQYPDWLLIQIEGDFMSRPVQVAVSKRMIHPESGMNEVMQLNMGEGKTSVIIPLVSSALSDGNTLARVIVPKPLFNQMFQLLAARLSGLAGRQIFVLPLSRGTRTESFVIQAIQDILQRCVRARGVLVMQPEHILSFQLLGIERTLRSAPSLFQDHCAVKLRSVQNWFHKHSRDLLDESDEVLHVRYQLIYTVGEQSPFEDHPHRWITVQQILGLVQHHTLTLMDRHPGEISVSYHTGYTFPRIQFFGTKIPFALSSLIARDILCGALSHIPLVLLPWDIQFFAYTFIIEESLPVQQHAALKSHCEKLGVWKSVLLLRGLLVRTTGVLSYIFTRPRWRVDYGLDPTRTQLAVPYRAKDVPSVRAEFGHPDITLSLTCLSYYYGGLSLPQLRQCFERLYKLEDPAMEYGYWMQNTRSVPVAMQKLHGVNLDDTEQFEQFLAPVLVGNHAVINFFLSQVVFPKEAKVFPHKLSTSGWDLAQEKNHVTTGFSGTNDNRYILPTSIRQRDNPDQLDTNARVLTLLLLPENNQYRCMQGRFYEPCTSKEFIDVVLQQVPEIRVLLDVGAQVLDLHNEALASYWLSRRPDLLAAVFFNETDDLTVITQDGSTEALASSSYAQQLDRCLVYLDEAHTRGTDLRLPVGTRAAVTLGPKVTKDRLVQGCMRMRLLGRGHSVMFFAPPEIDRSIRAIGRVLPARSIEAKHIIDWSIHESIEDIKRNVPHWAQQGVEFERRKAVNWNSDATIDLASLRQGWLQPGSRTLEEMYSPHTDPSILHEAYNIPHLRHRLLELELVVSPDEFMEEQEREVNHEVEQERDVERPTKIIPAEHALHPDVRLFVRTGFVPSPSQQFLRLCAPLPAGSLRDRAFAEPSLLATKDFSTTVKSGTLGLSDYMRPVHWIASSTKGDQLTLVVMSPYEVDILLPSMRAGRTAVRLHMYTARVAESMPSFSDLQFFCIPPIPKGNDDCLPSPRSRAVLNLWAGQLYVDNFAQYIALLRLLGIRVEISPNEGNGRIMVHGGGAALETVKQLVAFRRKGMSYYGSHLGQILHGKLLVQST
ncbi:hypothetical protein K474DRAFT_1755904 [Panus rudis PR-1116 ss-1]|nr:hypothetical protein K474DRAFT_1755904 [Panus rudis PR-1116 ss-1]